MGPLLLILVLLAWGASWLVSTTSEGWFERDVAMRAELAVNSGRASLIRSWNRRDMAALHRQLVEIAADSRIVATAACDPQGRTVGIAKTGTADPVPCTDVIERAGEEFKQGRAWHGHYSKRENLFVSAVPLILPEGMGFVIVVHDMAYAERRAAMTKQVTIVAFALLALAAAGITIFFTRHARRSWSREIRRLIGTTESHPEFNPILDDIKDLVRRLSTENEAAGEWTAERLKNTLERYLHGERIVILANREPYIHHVDTDGTVRVLHPASGLVTGLEPVMRACSGVWVAHGSGNADRKYSDKAGRVSVPPGENLYTLRRVWLSKEEEKGYYYGFANEGLWPLCHLAHIRPVFRADDWKHYAKVNERFAATAIKECNVRNPIIWIQDYHFSLVPRILRKKLPRATLLMFWHIPFPNAERFAICPWEKELLKGLLGCDILGFHTQLHCNNFLDACARALEARIDREHHAVVYEGRTTLVRPYPISVEAPSRWAEEAPSITDCRRMIREENGLPQNAIIGIGVDRLDYTKGILERFLAVERLLEKKKALRGRFSFIQLAAPSRTEIPDYKAVADHILAVTDRINNRFGNERYKPIHLKYAHHEPGTVYRYYRGADLCYVSSLHDGMNLVAKEFISARNDERGVLVLSHFTGASRELLEALIVNPYDLEEASSALAAAIEMPAPEQQARMRAMRRLISTFNIYRWAGQTMLDVSSFRQREKLFNRFARDRS